MDTTAIINKAGDRPKSFARFYCAFRKLTVWGEPEETKRQLVRQYTSGRTDSLKEITLKEYSALCAAVESLAIDEAELRRRRSLALKLMQLLGVDTTDWAQINSFCSHPRIAGKPFGRLSIDGLDALAIKLRAMRRKGWQRKTALPERKPATQTAYIISIMPDGSPVFE